MELHSSGKLEEIIKNLPDIANAGIEKSLYWWFNNIAPGHFKHGADRKYDYAARTPGYEKRKRKRGLPPLVWSGRAKDRLLRHGFFTVKKEKGKKTGITTGKFIAGPEIRYIYYQRRDTKKRKGTMNIAREITRISKEEFREMTDIARKEIIEKLNNTSGTPRIYR